MEKFCRIYFNYIILHKKNMNIFLKAFILLFFFSCRSENQEEFFKLNQNNTCDTLYVTYSKHIKPFFDNDCAYCHMNEMVPGCNLDNYENTIEYVRNTNTKLYDYVKNNDHQGAILDTCKNIQLRKWVQNPAP